MTTAAQFLCETFEFEFCGECHGDACHHTAIPFLGNWFARCDYPPSDDGTLHPVIRRYHQSREPNWQERSR